MRIVKLLGLIVALLACSAAAAQIHMGIDASEFRARRQAVMAAAPDGIVLLHSASAPKNWNDAGFLRDSFFYYFTGLENLHDAILAIDGISKQAWLFVLPPTSGRQQRISAALTGWDAAYLRAGGETEQLSGMDHVVSWEEFADFIETRRKTAPGLKFCLDQGGQGKMVAEVSNPPGLTPIENQFVLWTAAIKGRWPDANVVDAAPIIKPIRAVKSPAEVALLRQAARYTDAGFRAAVAAIAPGRTNHQVEGAAVEAAMRAGADSPGMWPELRSGAVSGATVFQKFWDYHLQNRTLHAGETVLINLGFNYELYKGDVGRTIPVSGRFTPAQAEVIDFMDEAYQAGLRAMRDGISGDEVVQTSIRYVADHAHALRSELARRAAAELLKPGVWVMYSHGIDAVEIFPINQMQMHTGNTIAFGPDINVDGVGFYEEDVSLITPSGHELINLALPNKAADIERTMARKASASVLPKS
jgi:Xaa-Pro aminopeptidase